MVSQEWELKIIVLVINLCLRFFFTFTWSVRQYNFALWLVGSAPLATERGSWRQSSGESYTDAHGANLQLGQPNQFNYGFARILILPNAFLVAGFLGPYFLVWPRSVDGCCCALRQKFSRSKHSNIEPRRVMKISCFSNFPKPFCQKMISPVIER